MGMVEDRRFCKICNASRLVRKRQINHILHLILSICTGGLWLIIWILLGICSVATRYRCSECGSKVW